MKLRYYISYTCMLLIGMMLQIASSSALQEAPNNTTILNNQETTKRILRASSSSSRPSTSSRPSASSSTNNRPSTSSSTNNRPSTSSLKNRPSTSSSIRNKPSTHGIPMHSDPTYGVPTNNDPTYGVPTNNDPTYGIPSNVIPTYGTPSNGIPSNGIPSNVIPTYGTPSNGIPRNGIPTNANYYDDNMIVPLSQTFSFCNTKFLNENQMKIFESIIRDLIIERMGVRTSVFLNKQEQDNAINTNILNTNLTLPQHNQSSTQSHVITVHYSVQMESRHDDILMEYLSSSDYIYTLEGRLIMHGIDLIQGRSSLPTSSHVLTPGPAPVQAPTSISNPSDDFDSSSYSYNSESETASSTSIAGMTVLILSIFGTISILIALIFAGVYCFTRKQNNNKSNPDQLPI